MSAEQDKKVLCFTYWTDPLCIWAYVAQSKLVSIVRSSPQPLLPLHRIVCVFGDIEERFETGVWSKTGRQGRAEKTREIAESFGIDNVSGQVWVDDTPSSSWAPAMAIKAVFAAERAGEIEEGRAAAYQFGVRRAFFEEDRNVAKREVQLELAEHFSVPRASLERRFEDGSAVAAVARDQDERRALGVRGSPTYVFDDAREMLYGNVPLALIEATVTALCEDGAPGRSPC
jgi:predicted DsbA family dithiol-disulfide isomerase